MRRRRRESRSRSARRLRGRLHGRVPHQKGGGVIGLVRHGDSPRSHQPFFLFQAEEIFFSGCILGLKKNTVKSKYSFKYSATYDEQGAQHACSRTRGRSPLFSARRGFPPVPAVCFHSYQLLFSAPPSLASRNARPPAESERVSVSSVNSSAPSFSIAYPTEASERRNTSSNSARSS